MAFAVALGLYALPTLMVTLIALRFATVTRILPHHETVLGRRWEDVDPVMQALLVTFLRASGAGLLGAAVAMWVLLLGPFLNRERWSVWAIPLVGIGWAGLSVLSARRLAKQTGVPTPWQPVAALAALWVLGLVAALLATR